MSTEAMSVEHRTHVRRDRLNLSLACSPFPLIVQVGGSVAFASAFLNAYASLRYQAGCAICKREKAIVGVHKDTYVAPAYATPTPFPNAPSGGGAFSYPPSTVVSPVHGQDSAQHPVPDWAKGDDV
jgi:hypothetical protein